jgi:hypothetical protein
MDTDHELADTQIEAALERLAAQLDKPEVKEWLEIRKEAGLKIDPETAEVNWWYAQTLDPYGVCPELPEECDQVGREYFARSPESDIWVSFDDLPGEVVKRIRQRMAGGNFGPSPSREGELLGDLNAEEVCAILDSLSPATQPPVEITRSPDGRFQLFVPGNREIPIDSLGGA